MTAPFTAEDVYVFKNLVFNGKEPVPPNERIIQLAKSPLEISAEAYLRDHLKPEDAENILCFKESVLKHYSSRDIPIALLAIGSTTYPRALMADVPYNDLDIVVLAQKEGDAKSASGKSRFDSRLVQAMEQYLLTMDGGLGYLPPEKLNLCEVTNRKTVFAFYGRPNTELKREGCAPLHIIVEAYNPGSFDTAKTDSKELTIITAPTADKIIPRQRSKNLPFSVLHE